MFSFQNLTFGFYAFNRKKLKIIQNDFELARARKFSGKQ